MVLLDDLIPYTDGLAVTDDHFKVSNGDNELQKLKAYVLVHMTVQSPNLF